MMELTKSAICERPSIALIKPLVSNDSTTHNTKATIQETTLGFLPETDVISRQTPATNTNAIIKPHTIDMSFFSFQYSIRKSAGLNSLAYPVNLGLRIAHQPRISNVEAHAVMKYYRNTMYIIPMDAGHRVTLRLVI